MNLKRNWITLLLVLLWGLGISGCKGRSAKNYAKLKVGMSSKEVSSIIGKPDTCKAMLNMKNCIWQDGRQEIRVKFVGDQVVFVASKGFTE